MDTGLMAQGTVRIRLHGHLWRYRPEDGAQVELPWPKGKNVAQMLEELGLPQDQVMLALVNGRPFPLLGQPEPGDTLELLPVIDGG